jgi:hypothetical protein
MLDPLQKLVRLSPPIAASLAVAELFTRTVQKLGHKDAVTRVNLLRILRTICDATEDDCTLIKLFGVYEPIHDLSRHDPAVLVRQMAEEMVHVCDDVGKRSTSRATGFRRPASSTGNRAGSGSSTGSTLASGMTPPTPTSLKTTFSIPSLPPTPTIIVEGGRRDRMKTRSQSTAGIWDLEEEPTHHHPKHPSIARSSTAIAALGVPSFASPSSSSHSHSHHSSSRSSSSRPPSRDTASAVARLEAANKDPSSSSSSSAGGRSSRLPKARQGRLSEAVTRRRQSQVNGIHGAAAGGEENQLPMSVLGSSSGSGAGAGGGSGNTTPFPRLQIVRRRRETSGGEMSSSLGGNGASGSGGGARPSTGRRKGAGAD